MSLFWEFWVSLKAFRLPYKGASTLHYHRPSPPDSLTYQAHTAMAGAMEKVVSSRAMVFGRMFLPLLPTYSITIREKNGERVERRVHSPPWNTSSINSPPPHPTQILHCRDCLNLAPSLVLSYIQMVDRKSRGVLVWLSAWLVCCLVSWKSQSFLVTARSTFPRKEERGCSKMMLLYI